MEHGEKTGLTNGLSSRPVSGVGDFSDALGRARPAAFFLGPNSGPGAGSSLADAMQNRGRDGARCSPHIPRPAPELAAGCSPKPSPATAAATNRKGKPAAANSRPMPAYHQGTTRVHSEDEEKRRVAVATEERKARLHEQIRALREWAYGRAAPASRDTPSPVEGEGRTA